MTTTLKCVLDTSVCIKYFIADPQTPKVIELFAHLAYPQTEIFVPELFYIECTNVFLKYVRANMYTAAEVQADLATLKNLQLQVVSTADLMEDAVNQDLRNWHRRSLYYNMFVLQQVTQLAKSVSAWWLCAFNIN
ncbi:MAG: hypothetical protein RLZZ507_2279 [Cyanobacteriota bacterium]|jgi:predicted nucleic acid-binding protein